MVPCSCHTGAFIVSPLLCEWPYLVQRSIWVVLLREAGGHHIPLVTLENATSFGYFWHQGWREGTSYMHLKDTRKMHPSSPTHPHFHSPSQPLSSFHTHPCNIYFLGQSHTVRQTSNIIPESRQFSFWDGFPLIFLPGASSGDTAL